MKAFTPNHLAKVQPMESMTLLSPQYWRVAEDLREYSRRPLGRWPGHYYVFPSVSTYMSCLEAFLKENLAMARRSLQDRVANGANEEDRLALADLLAEAKSPYSDFKPWLREIYKFFDRSGVGLDSSSPEYQNVCALKELRNAVTHYNPALIDYSRWPNKLQEAYRRASPEPINSGWVSGLSQPEVADWAQQTIRGAVRAFCELSGTANPLDVLQTHPAHLWSPITPP